MNKSRMFVIAAISEGEFGICLKFQYKNEYLNKDDFGKTTHKESETYYKWYDSINDNVVEGMEVPSFNPDNYEIREKAFVLPDTSEIVMLKYLYDIEQVKEPVTE